MWIKDVSISTQNVYCKTTCKKILDTLVDLS